MQTVSRAGGERKKEYENDEEQRMNQPWMKLNGNSFLCMNCVYSNLFQSQIEAIVMMKRKE